MFQVAVLASGSKGNAVLVRTRESTVLVDAGVSLKRIRAAIALLYPTPPRIDAVIVSHEHTDHLLSAGVVCRGENAMLYITEPTYLVARHKLGRLPRGWEPFVSGKPFTIGDLVVEPFAGQHDAVDHSNFVLHVGDDRRLGVATDIGFATRLLETKLRDCTTLVLESNHDIKMLLEGPYPWSVKQRIRSRQGHLSNEQTVGVLIKVLHPGLRNLVLAHLSEINNDPEIARATTAAFLASVRHDCNLIVAAQREPTPLLDV
ncbi:MAG: MBL fold metallo-hydrolase [Candidatus Cloacimonetes bacterium]|nr:MBL fold metallo-hydrolase [Candidatus Cloacimonadota bacterium]